MLNACSKEAPRVRKCYKPMSCTCFRLTGPNLTGPRGRRAERGGRGRGARQDAPPPAGARGTTRQPSLSPAGFLTVVRRPPGRSVL